MYDYLVFIGRFAPYHSGHHLVVTEALKRTKKLIVVLGSAGQPRSFRNPLYTRERREIMLSTLLAEGIDTDRITWVEAFDFPYNDEKWITQIQSLVSAVISRSAWTPDPIKIGLVGFAKDHSSYYLKMFPQWDSVNIEVKNPCNATDYRNRFFSKFMPHELVDHFYINAVHKQNVLHYCKIAGEEGIYDEAKYLREYKQSWAGTPYPPTFVTVDSLVSQSGHILVVERAEAPGKGLLALPGGFVNQNERLKDAAVRELYEETGLKVPKPVLYGSITDSKVFDDPHRSQRGRTITQCFHFQLADQEKLPKVKGGDDAAHAFWMTFADYVKSREKFFEDHHAMIETMLGF